ncbi:MAG: hypothetical protein AABO58_21690 [Acidobacteriota bacterium]
MGLREDIQKKIEKRQAELIDQERAFERQRAGAEAYIQALQDMLKSLPRDTSEVRPEAILRAGGAMAKTRDLILTARQPLHIGDILKGLGKNSDRKARLSVTSALGAYVRKGEVFVRTGPNTFGLMELGHQPHSTPLEEPPEDFGSINGSVG